MEIAVLSAAFAMGAAIPDRYACANFSPPLEWGEVPPNTQSIAILCDDPDAPAGDWVHWVLFNLAPETRSLPENAARNAKLPGGAVQGLNDYGRGGYDGPCPPPGRAHHYHFKVFALDARLALDSSARKQDLLRAMKGHILAQGALIGTYARRKP
ncbi:MAG TPA: YbhB/YbcL family Raf kinase inhibitor-like protein [Verrucomicrobia bacterium]|nr:YbhB/YbcL family Raf kinase inhibitor-like protein [Verrucomicrobiota bacterium]